MPWLNDWLNYGDVFKTGPATPGLTNINEYISKSSEWNIINEHLGQNCSNKPAAQAAGADPSHCNSTNRQTPPI